jgi:Protein of unknown function (DUF1549)/Protein of unknown function (DUF1553)
MRFRRFDDPRRVALVFAGVLTGAGVTPAEELLPSRVDRLIAAEADAAGAVMAPMADDAAFLRRVWLDFAGTIPNVAEARAFFAESSADKRIALIDRLIAGAPFADRMAEVFHIELMERGGDDENWKRFLTESFRANKPWDQMVREILSPEFTDEHRRGAGYFITRRLEKEGQQETDYPGLTRDVGRLFVGMDLQCCQCHKHLTVRDYKQADFNGLFVAFQNVKLNEPSGAYTTRWVSEGLMEKKFEFTSVLSGVKGETGPRVPLGVEVDLPTVPRDEQWLVPPSSKNGAGVPRFSPLKELAARLTAPENAFFARNIANRIWWQLIGRGLVEPLDLHHGENPASHPALLDSLAKEITAHAFDLKWLVRELALTQAYQRAGIIRGGEGAPPDHLFAVALERPLCAEQLARAFLTATGEASSVSGWLNHATTLQRMTTRSIAPEALKIHHAHQGTEFAL